MPDDIQGLSLPADIAATGRPGIEPLLVPSASQVLFVTPEIADFVKAGGLGEISAYLPRVLRREGMDVRVLVPGYSEVLQDADSMQMVAELPGLAQIPPCRIGFTHASDGLPIYVVICPELYERPGSPYVDESGAEFPDNDLRFARLSLAASDMAGGLLGLGWQPDLVHANDWPAALAPAYMAWRGVDRPSIMTVHNMAYQGVFEKDRMAALGMPEYAFQTEGVEFYGKISFLKAGLFYATHLTTVSPTYAREILTPEFGCGLDGLLRDRERSGQLTGILNGIDESYDPLSDPHLKHHFSRDDFSGKASNAKDLRAAFGLEQKPAPLFALVSRLVHQKGVDLVIASADAIVRGGGQVVATGQGEPELEKAIAELADRHPGAVGVKIGFDETTARRMYAGSDFLLMPSRYEPCGLSQMYAQRFGSLPIARNTGGLADTIQDDVTGFLFNKSSASSLSKTIHRALEAFHGGQKLHQMKRAAMQRPAGWRGAALRYKALYKRASVA